MLRHLRSEPDTALTGPMAETILSDDAQTFVVQSLACFDTPTTVARAVKAEFGADITKQAVEFYDPTKQAGRTLSERWRTLFHATREAFTSDAVAVGISHRSTRLRRLDRLYERAETQGNTALAAQLLAQAAKEVGDVYTNRQRIDATHNHVSHEDALGALE